MWPVSLHVDVSTRQISNLANGRYELTVPFLPLNSALSSLVLLSTQKMQACSKYLPISSVNQPATESRKHQNTDTHTSQPSQPRSRAKRCKASSSSPRGSDLPVLHTPSPNCNHPQTFLGPPNLFLLKLNQSASPKFLPLNSLCAKNSWAARTLVDVRPGLSLLNVVIWESDVDAVEGDKEIIGIPNLGEDGEEGWFPFDFISVGSELLRKASYGRTYCLASHINFSCWTAHPWYIPSLTHHVFSPTHNPAQRGRCHKTQTSN